MLFISACSSIQEHQVDKNFESVDVIIKDDQIINEKQDNDLSIESTGDILKNEVCETKQEEKKSNGQMKEQSMQEEKSNKSSSVGNEDSSSSKDESKNESSNKNETIENVKEQKKDASKNETNEEVKENIVPQPEIEKETKPVCENHNWDDSYGNSPKFNELIFDDWQDCNSMMNDIYNNFITEENDEYEKYYKNSNEQWISSIAAMDVWCECGAHKYAIFITYE